MQVDEEVKSESAIEKEANEEEERLLQSLEEQQQEQAGKIAQEIYA